MINELIFITSIVITISAIAFANKLGEHALTTLISVSVILANLFVTKQIILFGLTVTPCDVFTLAITLSLILLQERYGKKSAQKALTLSSLIAVLYVLCIVIQLVYIPAPTDLMHNHFSILLTPMPRIMIASYISFFISNMCDIYLYGFCKKINIPFTARATTTQAITQLIDTILFSFLALYGTVESVFSIIVFSYFFKLLIMSATPLYIKYISYIDQTGIIHENH